METIAGHVRSEAMRDDMALDTPSPPGGAGGGGHPECSAHSEGGYMRFRKVIGSTILGAFVAGSMIGCTGGTDVEVAKAPATTPAPPQELPKDPKKGGGTSSSGNMQRNPGADPLAK